MESQEHAAHLALHLFISHSMSSGDLNLGPHACKTSHQLNSLNDVSESVRPGKASAEQTETCGCQF